MSTDLDTMVDNARAALGSQGKRIGPASGAARYELFNAANSICSQKVRTVLAYHHIPWIHHPVDLFSGQSYLPDYVRLRMVGCEAFGGPLADRHRGSTSASVGGCDGVVVPTLVDRLAGEVVVDSKRICLTIDATTDRSRTLVLGPFARDIEAELAIVDELPNYQLLMGRKPSATEDAATREGTAGRFSERKVEWCDDYLQTHGDEPVLVRAYRAKRAKELSAAETLFSVESMTAAHAQANAAIAVLEDKLSDGDAPWLFGPAPTMADLFWGIELIRMERTGVAALRDGRLPRVARLALASAALPAVREAVLEWPGAVF